VAPATFAGSRTGRGTGRPHPQTGKRGSDRARTISHELLSAAGCCGGDPFRDLNVFLLWVFRNVNLSCNDGTNVNLALDTTAVTALASAVSSMSLYPAGDSALACGLSQTASAPPGSGNPNIDYAVGCGRALLVACVNNSPIRVETNFALNAHVDAASNGTSGTGTFNVTVPKSATAACPPGGHTGGHFNGRIECVLVSGNTAQATLRVTQASGQFAGGEGVRLVVNVRDSGMPGGTGDLITVTFPSGPGLCAFGPFSATHSVDNGNITVHQVS
jgi:hypothetical protein